MTGDYSTRAVRILGNLGLLPGESRQALRVLRFLMAVAAALLLAALLATGAAFGLVSKDVAAWSGGAIVGLSVGFYAIFRAGLNLRFRDPSLTFEMCAIAILVHACILYNVPMVRGVLVLTYAMILLFGVFRLTLGRMLALAALALGAHACMILVAAARIPGTNLAMEWMQFAALAAVLPMFSLLAGYVRSLHINLTRSNRQLAQSEVRFTDFARASGDWFWESDAEGRLTWISSSIETLLGVPVAAYLGRTQVEVAAEGEDSSAPHWLRYKEKMAAHEPFRDFRYLKRGPLGERWISSSGLPVFNPAGAFAGYRGSGTDITERVSEEGRARAATEQLMAALDKSNESVLMCDAEDRFVFTNQKFRDSIPGLEHLVVPGARYLDFLRGAIAEGYFPEANGQEDEWIEKRLSQRHVAQGSVSRHIRGERCWLVSDRGLPDGSTISSGLEITQWKRAEDELLASRRLLEQVIDSIPMSIFAKDLQSNYVMVNQYMADFFGTSKAGLLQHHTSELPSLDATRQQSLRDDHWVFENRVPLVHETFIQKPDGTPVPYHSSKIPLFDASGALTGLLGVNRDTTEQRAAQAQLRASEQLFAAMFHDSPGPLAVVDPDTRRFLDINHAFLSLFGYQREQVIGHTAAEFGAVNDLAERSALYEALMRDGFVNRMELASLTAGGSVNLSLVSGRVIETGERRIALFSFSDITELSRAQGEIEQINASLEDRVRERTTQLELANRELESFSYSVSHDLKSPLRAIDGAVGILNMKFGDRLPEGVDTYLARISQSARRMARLIEGLLEFARLSRKSLNRILVQPGEIAALVLQENEEAIRERSVAKRIDPLPSCDADPVLLRQVFENLVSNALKYSAHAPSPAIEIGTSRDQGEVAYYVRDNGVGFDMAYVDKLFGVFERLHTAEEFEGTGIGLALVRRIVERHGGRVWAQSAPGQGATFYFTIGARSDERPA